MTAVRALSRVKTWHAPGLPPLPVIIALAAVYLIWGSTYLATVIVLESYPPFMLTALRLLIAALILLLTMRARREARSGWREIANAAFTGAMMFAGAGMVALGQELGVASGLASLAVGAVPLWATLFSFGFGHRPGRVEALGLTLGIIGVGILNMGSAMQGQALGAFVVLAGAMLWAFGSVLSRRMRLPRGFNGVMWQMCGGLLALALISFISGERIAHQPTMAATLGLLYLAVVGTLVAFSAYMYLMRRVRPALATSYAYVNPVIAVILGAALLAEPLTGSGVVATVVIVTGVGLVMLGKGR